MPERTCIFHDRSDNCFVMYSKQGRAVVYTGSFEFFEEPRTGAEIPAVS